jgi:hypothetical protein
MPAAVIFGSELRATFIHYSNQYGRVGAQTVRANLPGMQPFTRFQCRKGCRLFEAKAVADVPRSCNH